LATTAAEAAHDDWRRRHRRLLAGAGAANPSKNHQDCTAIEITHPIRPLLLASIYYRQKVRCMVFGIGIFSLALENRALLLVLFSSFSVSNNNYYSCLFKRE
jgi:hypothetical protein